MKTLYISLFLCLPLAVFSQQALQSELNAPREGDNLIKQSVPYRPAGEAGENIVWDFSSATVVDTDYPVLYFSREEEAGLIGAEPGRLLHYNLTGDSLLMTGYESPSVLVKYSSPALLLKFPIIYGDSLQDRFAGRGKHYDRIKSIVAGKLNTSADGFGTIVLPNKERLENIVRIHTQKTETSRYASIPSKFNILTPPSDVEWADTLRFTLPTTVITDIYQWYESGYRYPVFETVESGRVSDDTLISLQQSSFFYHPLDQVLDTGEEQILIDSPQTDETLDPWEDLVCTLSPNPASSTVAMEMFLPLGAEIHIQVHTTQGFTYIHQDLGFYPEGEHRITLDVSALPTDNYVLDVWLNEHLLSLVLMKR